MKQKVLDFVISTKQGYGDSSFYYILKNKDTIFTIAHFIKKENKTMTKTIKINGMMCSHCTGRVGEVLNAIDGVSAEVSLDNGGQAVVTLAKDVSDDVLKKAVVDAGYEVVGIE